MTPTQMAGQDLRASAVVRAPDDARSAACRLLSSTARMRLRLIVPPLLALAALLVSSNENVAAARLQRPRPTVTQRRPAVPPPVLSVPTDTRLLVIAPHPDDEVLGAGGLMQRVYEGGGSIRVVYLTDGDGYPEGVQAEDHIESPTPADYRGYGRQRRREARAALTTLGLGASTYTYTFLNFPDGGLCQLMHTYWSERRRAYRSPYTRLNRPPVSEMLVPQTEYRGEDLTQELAQIIGEFQPTLIVVPRKEDQHPDHCAAWFFLADGRHQLRRALLRLAVRRRWSAARAPAGLARRRVGLDALPAHARGNAQQAARAAPLRDADARDGLVSERLRAFKRSVLAPGIDARRPAEPAQPLL
jgi:LmbE family N-acetylglucosaminyl deacetylase